MEPENTSLEKEKQLPNYHFQVLCWSSWVYRFLLMYFWMHLDATIRQVAKYTNLHARGATMASLVWVARLPRFYCSCWLIVFVPVHGGVLLTSWMVDGALSCTCCFFLLSRHKILFIFESAITSNKKLLCNIRNWWAGQTPIFCSPIDIGWESLCKDLRTVDKRIPQDPNWKRIISERSTTFARQFLRGTSGLWILCIQVVENNCSITSSEIWLLS